MFDVHSQGKNDTELVTEGDLLGQFSYAIDSTPIQEFTVKDVSFIAWMAYASTHTHILLLCSCVVFFLFSPPFLSYSRRVRLIHTFYLIFFLIMAILCTLVCIE